MNNDKDKNTVTLPSGYKLESIQVPEQQNTSNVIVTAYKGLVSALTFKHNGTEASVNIDSKEARDWITRIVIYVLLGVIAIHTIDNLHNIITSIKH